MPVQSLSHAVPPRRQLGFYSCSGPARCFDPYSYYLLQQWHVFAIGGRWAGFWAFGDNGGTSCWNEYVAKGNGPYCPLYLDEVSVTTAKYLEAIREGVQDYEYLVMLRDRIGALEGTRPDHPRLAEAKKLLATAPDRVLKAAGATEYRWDAPRDRTLADRVRVEILDMLTALAVHLKKAGLPRDMAVAALMAWAVKNRPDDGKADLQRQLTEVRRQKDRLLSLRLAGEVDPQTFAQKGTSPQ